MVNIIKVSHTFNARNKELFRAVVGKLRHIKQVRGDAGHNLPHLGVVKIVERKLLQMIEHSTSHVRFDFGAHNVSHGRHKEIGCRVHQTQKQIEPADFEHQPHGQGGQIVDARVGHIPYQHGQHQLADGGQRRTEQIKKEYAFILFKVGNKPANQSLGVLLLFRYFLYVFQIPTSTLS